MLFLSFRLRKEAQDHRVDSRGVGVGAVFVILKQRERRDHQWIPEWLRVGCKAGPPPAAEPHGGCLRVNKEPPNLKGPSWGPPQEERPSIFWIMCYTENESFYMITRDCCSEKERKEEWVFLFSFPGSKEDKENSEQA